MCGKLGVPMNGDRAEGPYKGARVCLACLREMTERHPDTNPIDAEITRRLALKSAPVDETRALKVGDRVRVLRSAICDAELRGKIGVVTELMTGDSFALDIEGARRTGWVADEVEKLPAEDWQPKVGELCEGLACSNGEPLSGAFASFTYGGNATLSSGRIISRSSLRPVKDAPARAESTHTWDVLVDACSVCGITGHQYHAAGQPLCTGRKTIQPTAPGRTDPYVEHARKPVHGYADWHAAQTGIATGITKHEQAKSQLERKVSPKYPHWAEAWSTAGWESDW